VPDGHSLMMGSEATSHQNIVKLRKRERDSKGRSKATRSECDDLEESAVSCCSRAHAPWGDAIVVIRLIQRLHLATDGRT